MSTTAAALLDLVLHEMRTPLTVATGSLRQVGPLGEPTAQAAVDRALRSCARLDQLASQVRDWVRTIETPPATEVHQVDDLVRNAAVKAASIRTPPPAVQIDQGPTATVAGVPALADALASLVEAVGRAAEPGETVRLSWAPHGDGTRITLRRGDRPDADPLGTFDAELLGGLGFALPLARAIVEAGGGQLTSRRDAQGRVDAVTLLLAPATPPR